jgi:hypothetical protein
MNRSPRCGCHTGLTRRSFLADCGMGFTGLVLGAMLHRDGIARAAEVGSPDGRPHFSPKAKRIIWLCMLGGVSHLESFDPKPALNKYAGKTIAESPHKEVLESPFLKDNVRELIAGDHKVQSKIYPMQVGYKRHGRSGIALTDWWPHLASCIDELAIVRSIWTTDNDHTAQYQLHTGRHIFDGSHPSIGAWVHYGLGSLNDNLPQFIVLSVGEPPGPCCGGAATHGAAYLGPEHAGVRLKTDGKHPLPYAAPAPGTREEEQRAEFELLQDLNGLAAAKYPDDPALRARIQSYELAFRMQHSVPEILRLDGESAATRKLYGIDNEVTKPFGQVCLTARRLAEKGVRFVQVYHGDGPSSLWDAHAKLKENHSGLCAQVDRPIAGLLKDLKQRGLLDETLVVWTTEFGRTPGAEGADGRDHHPYGFSVWFAGGGVRGGIAHGATDELGFHALGPHRHYVTDIHTTVLHQLGLDPRRLEVPGQKRLEIDFGRPIRDILA